MVVKNFRFKIKNKEQNIKVRECKNLFSKAIGLMFKKNSSSLLFIFKKPTSQPIHSFFCKTFIAVWFLKDKIIEIKLINKKLLSIKPKQEFDRLLEIPSNTKEFKILLSVLSTEAERFKY